MSVLPQCIQLIMLTCWNCTLEMASVDLGVFAVNNM